MNAIRTSWVSLVVAASVLLAGCERPPVDVVQNGFRGTGMENVYNPRTIKKQESLHKAPDALEPADASGPRAKQVYKNVQVLGDLSVGEFTRVMVAMTQWVSPEQGCLYCHNAENFADDSKYTKTVARRMTQMTQHLNAAWKNHVAETGVTCYTCHRGNPIPKQAWTTPEDQNRIKSVGLLGNRNNQNEPGLAVGLSTLPRDPFNAYFVKETAIRQIPQTALPQGVNSNGSSTQGTEGTYGLMIHMSESLGVNCTYCHNTRSFTSWETSPPRRLNAYHGIRMVRELNNEFIIPLEPIVPASQKGPKGDIAKVNCSTCHQGAYKPLYGASMAKDHPELKGPAQKLASSAASPAGNPNASLPAGAKATK